MVRILSGGAEGADIAFENEALSKGHEAVSFSFKGHKTESRRVKLLSFEQLIKADSLLFLCAKKLNRTFPTKSDYVNNLLRRNFYQIASSQCVVAIAGLEFNKKNVKGGTGWAVEMAKLFDITLFLFDQEACKWYSFTNEEGIEHWIEEETTPSLKHYKRVTGIGSRKLTDNGANSIKAVMSTISDVKQTYQNRMEK
ncbi:MAG: hypothetical protein JEZ09_17785 [Salinivirgaceae bacterium]|nr:hypothetical protein [Salinivirgaceae bacterium]